MTFTDPEERQQRELMAELEGENAENTRLAGFPRYWPMFEGEF